MTARDQIEADALTEVTNTMYGQQAEALERMREAVSEAQAALLDAGRAVDLAELWHHETEPDRDVLAGRLERLVATTGALRERAANLEKEAAAIKLANGALDVATDLFGVNR